MQEATRDDLDAPRKALILSQKTFLVEDLIYLVKYLSAHPSFDELLLHALSSRYQTKLLIEFLRQLDATDLKNLLGKFKAELEQNKFAVIPWISSLLDAHQLSMLMDPDLYLLMGSIRSAIEQNVLLLENLEATASQIRALAVTSFEVSADLSKCGNSYYQLDKDVLL